MKTVFIPLLSLSISTVWAMESIQTDPLDVEGIYRNRSNEYDRRFEKSNEKTQDRLREKTDELNRKISKKKEDKLIETDEKITSKVLQVIEGIDLNDEKPSTPASSTPPVEQNALPPMIHTFKEEPEPVKQPQVVGLSKFTPYIGMMNIKNDRVNLNAETSVGVIAESMLLNEKTSLFVDFNYSDLTMEPILTETVANIQDYVIDYRRYSLDLGIKGYLLKNHAMKPFVVPPWDLTTSIWNTIDAHKPKESHPTTLRLQLKQERKSPSLKIWVLISQSSISKISTPPWMQQSQS